jgi:hypothetical protein
MRGVLVMKMAPALGRCLFVALMESVFFVEILGNCAVKETHVWIAVVVVQMAIVILVVLLGDLVVRVQCAMNSPCVGPKTYVIHVDQMAIHAAKGKHAGRIGLSVTLMDCVMSVDGGINHVVKAMSAKKAIFAERMGNAYLVGDIAKLVVKGRHVTRV